jgi:hypothetical protein
MMPTVGSFYAFYSDNASVFVLFCFRKSIKIRIKLKADQHTKSSKNSQMKYKYSSSNLKQSVNSKLSVLSVVT